MRIVSTIVGLMLMSHSAQGAVRTFILDDPSGKNFVQFTSSAMIEKIVGTTSNVGGKVTLDPDNLKAPVQAAIKVDLRTISTGIAMRDEHMRSDNYLNTTQFPEATFEFDGAPTAVVAKLEPGKPADVSFSGKFTVHGVTRPVTVTGKATFLNEIPEWSQKGYPGDVLYFDGGFTILLRDYNIQVPQLLVLKLAEEVAVNVSFTATTGRTQTGE